jgi:hypothetical protein
MAVDARANVNIITNGDFETGDFTGWTTNAVSFPMYIVTNPVNSGSYAAQIAGYSYGPDTLSQGITTTPGLTYILSFARFQSIGDPVISLDVTWDGTTVFSEFNPGAQPFQTFSASVVGTGFDTLVFTSANDPGYTYLDDVSLTPTPEPALYGLLGFGLSALAYSRRSARINKND